MNCLFSIIIPSFNAGQTIKFTLDSLNKQKYIDNFEVIISDSSSDDSVEKLVKSYCLKNMTYKRVGIKVIPSIARNLGAEDAKGKFLVFLDSDVILRPNFLLLINEAITKGYRAGGGSIEVPDFQANKKIVIAQYYLQLNEYLPIGKDRNINFPAGCSIYCEKALFEEIGGFPEIRAAEDVLFGLNINKVSKFWFIPNAIVGHIFRENKDGFYRNQHLLGKYVAKFKKEKSDIILFKGIIPYLFFPLFAFTKFSLITNRILKAGGSHILEYLKVMPFVFLGIYYWTKGFIEGCVED